jgi:hypothetical protein
MAPVLRITRPRLAPLFAGLCPRLVAAAPTRMVCVLSLSGPLAVATGF